MLNRHQRFGRFGEDLAVRFLKDKGYRIITTNHRTPFGEIDIIAEDGDTLVFIEVKSRKSDAYGPPAASVDRRKQRKISMSALSYLKSAKKIGSRSRFDVVAIRLTDRHPQIEVIKNAFELAYG